MRDLADRGPVDEPAARATHDLARRDRRAEGEQPTDDDARRQAGGMTCHAGQSTGTPAGSMLTDSTAGRRSPKSRSGDGHEGVHVARSSRRGGRAAHRSHRRARAERVQEVLDRQAVVNAESTTATSSPTMRPIGARSSG